MVKLNTSNPDKLREYRKLGLEDLKVSTIDLEEPDADPYTVIRYKATQAGPDVLVEDTSLDVEGADIGINIKWLLASLDELTGRKATFRVLIGVLQEGKIKIYQGEVSGKLVECDNPSGFGFDPYFLPDGATQTLSESKPKKYNARALAVQNVKKDRPHKVADPIHEWGGPFQKD